MNRYIVNTQNVDQVTYFIRMYIFNKDVKSMQRIIPFIITENMSSLLYDVCLDIYLNYSAIFTPEYLKLLLSYKNEEEYLIELTKTLMFMKKEYIFDYLQKEYRDYYFFLQENVLDCKHLHNNITELQTCFSTYFSHIEHYRKNADIRSQLTIVNHFSNLLYYLNNHDNYDSYNTEVWKIQKRLFHTSEKMYEYCTQLRVLHDYTWRRKWKLLLLLYTLLYRFIDLSSSIYMYSSVQEQIKSL